MDLQKGYNKGWKGQKKVNTMNKKTHYMIFLAITLVISILATTSVYADFYTDFRSPRVVCTENYFQILTTHNGRLITPDEIQITATDEMGATTDVVGKWYIQNKPVSYIVGETASAYTEVNFIANSMLPKNENYKITFSYKRTSEAYDYTTLQFIANCPGRLCTSNLQCADSETCNNGQCKALDCNVCQKPYLNACVPKCSDANTCTKDICREGVCSYTEIPNCCVNNLDCNDALTCTNDVCANQRCQHSEVVCEGTQACVTGACQEGQGCVYDTNLTCLNEENRRYVLQLGAPKVVEKETRPTNILSWILTFFKNFFS